MSRYIYFTKLKHLIFINGGSIFNGADKWPPANNSYFLGNYSSFCQHSTAKWVSHVIFAINSQLTSDLSKLQKSCSKVVGFDFRNVK
jgi:hypothetical protein